MIEIPTEQIIIAIGGLYALNIAIIWRIAGIYKEYIRGLYALNIAIIWRIAGIYKEIGYIRGKISACLGDDPDGETKGKIPENT